MVGHSPRHCGLAFDLVLLRISIYAILLPYSLPTLEIGHSSSPRKILKGTKRGPRCLASLSIKQQLPDFRPLFPPQKKRKKDNLSPFCSLFCRKYLLNRAQSLTTICTDVILLLYMVNIMLLYSTDRGISPAGPKTKKYLKNTPNNTAGSNLRSLSTTYRTSPAQTPP